MGRMTSHILWKIKNHVPNHQLVYIKIYIHPRFKLEFIVVGGIFLGRVDRPRPMLL